MDMASKCEALMGEIAVRIAVSLDKKIDLVY